MNDQKNSAPIKYNLIWDNEPDAFRSSIVNKPVYEMKCMVCLTFIGAFSKPSKCPDNYCRNCGSPLKSPAPHRPDDLVPDMIAALSNCHTFITGIPAQNNIHLDRINERLNEIRVILRRARQGNEK